MTTTKLNYHIIIQLKNKMRLIFKLLLKTMAIIKI